MSIKEGTSTELLGNFFMGKMEPLDAKLIFDSIEQAQEQIVGNTRFKGQKFSVKNVDNELPTEYWFTKDYKPRISSGFPPVVTQEEYIPTLENGGLVPYLPEQEDWSDEIEVARLNAVQEAQEIVDTHEEKTDVHNISGQIKSAA